MQILILPAFDIVLVGILSSHALKCISKAYVARTFRFRPPGLSLILGMAKRSIRRIVTNLLTRRSGDFCQTRASKLKPRGKMRATGTH
jgi:hypothetical protein